MKMTYLFIVVDFILALILFLSDFHIYSFRVFLGSYFLFDCSYLIMCVLRDKGYLTIFEEKKRSKKNVK